jgi:hypothetical protein
VFSNRFVFFLFFSYAFSLCVTTLLYYHLSYLVLQLVGM